MKDLDEVISSLKCTATWLDNGCAVKESVAEVMLNIKALEKLQNKLEASNEEKLTAADKYKEACSLLDACYEVVEIWDCQAPSQIEWKRQWLEGARKHGAGGE